MAEAEGKLSGHPGICFVTRGPGATNASSGLHVAMQDSTPMILLIGQIARKDIEREAFQEIDYRRMFSQVAKWVAQIDDADRIPEFINRAFSVATSGRPGPVVLALPEDMLRDQTDASNMKAWKAVKTSPAHTDLAQVASLLKSAQRPVAIIGGSGWSERCRTQLEAFAAANQLAVANSFRCQDYFNNDHPNYIGDLGLGVNPALTQVVRDSDCLLVIGSRLGEMTTGGFDLIDIPTPRQPMIHVHSGAEELGHIYQPTLAINSHSERFIESLASFPGSFDDARAATVEKARQAFVDWNRPIINEGELQLSEVIHSLRQQCDDDTIICNGAGNNTGWLHRFLRFRRYRTQLAPTSGSMGYGLPAAIAAKLHHPDRCVVAVAGDGDLMMTLPELATAMQHQVGIIVIVINNGIYATIRMHQERAYPNRVIGTDMINPDFITLAKAHNAHTELVVETAEFEAAFQRAKASLKLALIEIRLSPNILTPTATVESLRQGR